MRLVQFNGWVGPQLLSAYAPLWTCSVSHKIIALTAASFCRFNGRFFAVGSRPTNPMIKPAGASCSRKGRLADHLSSQAARQLWPPRVRHRQACRRLQEGLARRSDRQERNRGRHCKELTIKSGVIWSAIGGSDLSVCSHAQFILHQLVHHPSF